MGIFALLVLDNTGKILHAQPEGCQFQQQFLEHVVGEESQIKTPHPNKFDMGGYFLHSLWSGIDPFIIVPNYLIAIVSDVEVDENLMKRSLRKVANNILLYKVHKQSQFIPYINQLWLKVEKEAFDSINLMKPDDFTSEKEKDSGAEEDGFGELLEISQSVEGSTQNPFSNTTNSSSTQNSALYPFGDGSSSDPFGGTSSADPFGGSSKTAVDPFSTNSKPQSMPISNQNKVEYDPNLFGTIEKKSTITSSEKSELFETNPWENDLSDDSGTSDELFTDNPFANSENAEDDKKKKESDLDPFTDNPFA